jgi:hypothetical protein
VKVYDVLPKSHSAEDCAFGDRQTLSAEDEGTVVWKWSRPDPFDASALYEVEVRLGERDDELVPVPSSYLGTWDNGQGLHLTISPYGIDAAGSVVVLDTRSSTRCVWHGNVFTIEENRDLLYGPLHVDRAISDKSCRRAGLHRARLSSGGDRLSVSPYQEDTGTIPASEMLQLQRVGP